MSRRAVRIVVSGRVQGVFFRAHTERRARGLGVSGSVRNLPDGTVEIFAEGDVVKVDELVKWAWEGSPFSKVREVEVEERRPSGDDSIFETRY